MCGVCNFAAFPWLVTSEKHCQDPCSEPQWAQPDWQIDNDQSWRILKPWYTGGGSEKQGFQCCLTDGLNQK